GGTAYDYARAPAELYPDSPEIGPCGGGTVEVDPGLYVLEYPAGDGGRYAQTLTAMIGRLTQVFRLYRAPDDRAGRPVTVAVLVHDPASGRMAFDRRDPDDRLSELVRIGLANDQPAVPDAAIAAAVT